MVGGRWLVGGGQWMVDDGIVIARRNEVEAVAIQY
jgi:hypothetical protein